MKKIILSLLTALPLCAAAQSAFTIQTEEGQTYSFPITSIITVTDNEPWQPATEDYTTISFDGDDWDALIDSKEYGGPLLYGESGSGFGSDETPYYWMDEATTLYSTVNAGDYGTAFWAGGTAVSNYHCAIADGGYTTQLSIPTDMAAHSGDNFLVAYGYFSPDAGAYAFDSRAKIEFADGTARKVRGLWVTPTSYFLNSTTLGDGYNSPATESTYVYVTFEGFDTEGNSTGTVKRRLQNGTTPLAKWAYVDLTPLGKVVSFKINFDASEDQIGSYGLNTPAYVAIDDIEVCK